MPPVSRAADHTSERVEIERDTIGRLVPAFYDLYRSWVERWIPRSDRPSALARFSRHG